jgi:hypothetical protein
MESPAGPAQPERYRPSPGFKAKPSSDPTPEPTKKTTGGGKGAGSPGRDIVPWETAGQRWGRLSKEKAHNLGRQAQQQQAADKAKYDQQFKADAPAYGKWKEWKSKQRPGGEPALMTGLDKMKPGQGKRFEQYYAKEQAQKKQDQTSGYDPVAAKRQQEARTAVNRMRAQRVVQRQMQNIVQSNKALAAEQRMPPHCFPAGTLITLSTWEKIPIENVGVGTKVVSWHNDDLLVAEVVRTMEADSSEGYTTINGKFVSTPEHPYYTQRGWIPASKLEPGDGLLEITKAGDCWILVESVETKEGSGKVYNITVDTSHNYVANGVLVHNKTIMYGTGTGSIGYRK